VGLKRKSGTVRAWLRDRIGVMAASRNNEERFSAGRREAPIDRDVLARLRGLQDEDEADIVAELATMFLEDARSGLQTVEEALQKGDAPTIETVAHKLKGGSGNLGAGGLVGLFTRLEDMGASGDLSAGFELLERLRKELGKVDLALAAEVQGDEALRRSDSSPTSL
jgi:HPt (histidine-containing phosphotransfer) domain-containing protein